MQWLFESLSEHRIPFIYAHVPAGSMMTPQIQAVFDNDPNALIVKVAPQAELFQHPAISFFVVCAVQKMHNCKADNARTRRIVDRTVLRR